METSIIRKVPIGRDGMGTKPLRPIVHYASGLLFTPPLIECLQRAGESRRLLAFANAFAWVLAIGAIYEVFEWQLAVNMSPRMAESYNGQQGDIWDAQKDLALAAAGSMTSAAILPLINYIGSAPIVPTKRST